MRRRAAASALAGAAGEQLDLRSAGASRLTVHWVAGVPARVELAAGAGSATVDGVGASGLAAGTAFTQSGGPRPETGWTST